MHAHLTCPFQPIHVQLDWAEAHAQHMFVEMLCYHGLMEVLWISCVMYQYPFCSGLSYSLRLGFAITILRRFYRKIPTRSNIPDVKQRFSQVLRLRMRLEIAEQVKFVLASSDKQLNMAFINVSQSDCFVSLATFRIQSSAHQPLSAMNIMDQLPTSLLPDSHDDKGSSNTVEDQLNVAGSPMLSDAEQRRLYRKIDMRLLPILTVMLLCSFLDRGMLQALSSVCPDADLRRQYR